MRTGSQIYEVKINSCPNEFYWFNNHINETVTVADSGEDGEWYIVVGEHEGKHLSKPCCSFVEMTMIEMELEKPHWIEKVSA